MNNKLKKIIQLLCLVVCIGIVIIKGWNEYKRWQLRKNEFCAKEILRNICNEQLIYGQKFNEFLDFEKLRKVTNNKLLQKLTSNIKNGVVTRHGYSFCIYLLSGENIYLGNRKVLPNKNFICYAWPLQYGKTGYWSFAIDCGWDLYGCANTIQKYSGNKKPSSKAGLEKNKSDSLEGVDREYWVTGGSDIWYNHEQNRKWFTCD